MKGWTENDRHLLALLKDREVLAPVEPGLADHADGSVVVFCGYAVRSTDLVNFHRRMQEFHRETPRMHKLSLNGGGLRLIADRDATRKSRFRFGQCGAQTFQIFLFYPDGGGLENISLVFSRTLYLCK